MLFCLIGGNELGTVELLMQLNHQNYCDQRAELLLLLSMLLKSLMLLLDVEEWLSMIWEQDSMLFSVGWQGRHPCGGRFKVEFSVNLSTMVNGESACVSMGCCWFVGDRRVRAHRSSGGWWTLSRLEANVPSFAVLVVSEFAGILRAFGGHGAKAASLLAQPYQEGTS